MASNAHKKRAKELSARTGMVHTLALDTVALAINPPQPPHRWVLSDDLRAFAAGEGWQGMYFEPFYEVLDRLKVRFECDWCAEDADARTEDCTIQISVGKYDPDLSPFTPWLWTKKFHARCQPSMVTWGERMPDFGEIYEIGLPAAAKPEMHGEFALIATPFQSESDPEAPPILFLTATVTEDHGQGAVPWLNELEMMLREHGFGLPDELAWEAMVEEEDQPDPWGLRIVMADDKPTWIALRMSPPTLGEAPDHLFLGTLHDSSAQHLDAGDPRVPWPFEDWTRAAHAAGRVLVVFGPMPVDGQLPDIDLDKLSVDELDELTEMDGFAYIQREVRVVSVEPEPAELADAPYNPELEFPSR